jgi:hypothetical protein
LGSPAPDPNIEEMLNQNPDDRFAWYCSGADRNTGDSISNGGVSLVQVHNVPQSWENMPAVKPVTARAHMVSPRSSS